MLVYWLLLLLLVFLLCGSPAEGQRTGSYRLYFPLVPHTPNKLGMAGCPASCTEFGCGWCYDWSAQPVSGPGIETVPMIYDEKYIEAEIAGNSRWLMGFNEPDKLDQAGMSIEQAVTGWARIEERFPDRLLVAPTPSSRAPGWLAQMRAAFVARYGRDPRWDALGVHCHYHDPAWCAAYVESVIEQAHAWGIGEVWVTEWEMLSAERAQAFGAWLAANPGVTRQAVYVARQDCGNGTYNCNLGDPSLVQADGCSLTEAGWWHSQPQER